MGGKLQWVIPGTVLEVRFYHLQRLNQVDPLLEFINTVQPQPQLNTPVQVNMSTPEQAFQAGVNLQYTGSDNHSLIHGTCSSR